MRALTASTTFEPFVDAASAGEFLKLHPATVQRLAREGALPAHAVIRGRRKKWRFLLSELTVWLSSETESRRSGEREGG